MLEYVPPQSQVGRPNIVIDKSQAPINQQHLSKYCIINIDAMAVVNKLAVLKLTISACLDMAWAFVNTFDRKSTGHTCTYVTSDDYSRLTSMTDLTRQKRGGIQ